MQMFCITRIIDQNKHFLESKEMIISFTHDVNFKKYLPNIIIEGIPVEVVKHAKLLGVILSDDLTWNMHVDSIVKKVDSYLIIIIIVLFIYYMLFLQRQGAHSLLQAYDYKRVASFLNTGITLVFFS